MNELLRCSYFETIKKLISNSLIPQATHI